MFCDPNQVSRVSYLVTTQSTYMYIYRVGLGSMLFRYICLEHY